MLKADVWEWWTVDLYRGSLELDDRCTPRGLAIELEVWLDGSGLFCVWVLSETGQTLWPARVGQA